MGVFHHAQESFAAGELSPRTHGLISSQMYGRGLSLCRNWMVLPQGPLLMRAGSVRAGSEAALPRLFNFRSSSAQEDWTIAVSPGHLRIYTRGGLIAGDGPELVTNGDFGAGLTGWTTVSGYVTRPPNFYWAQLGWTGGVPGSSPGGRIRQAIGVVPGNTYRLHIRVENIGGATSVRIGATLGNAEYFLGLPTYWSPVDTTLTFVATTATTYIDIEQAAGGSEARVYGSLWNNKPTSLKQAGGVIDLVAPWSQEQLPLLQCVPEPAKDKLYFFHPNVQPQVLAFTAPATWALAAAAFTSKPADWNGTNWPSFGEMFQGRLVAGGTPDAPNTIWGSKPGAPLDFTMGSPATAGDAYTFVISTKGVLRWAQGQKALLMGTDFTEHSAAGASGIIWAGDIDVRDESAWGSAPIQALHLGDQVVFVSRERRHVRSLSYSLQDNGWISRALTFLADHITEGAIQEIAFARTPQPILLVLKATGEIAAATYDRAEQVIAWWRIALSAPVHSISIADGPDGSWLWLAVDRAGDGTGSIEYLPLHETGAVYVDAAVSGQVANDGTLSGLDHLEGQSVRVIVDGQLDATDGQVVAGGKVQGIDVSLAGKSITVGLGYRATAKTLPPEGGNPKGTAQLSNRRTVQVMVRLNDSAPPLINGERPADRSPATPMDEAEPRVTGDRVVYRLREEDAAVLTLEQDLPFRTEILAAFRVIQVQDVH